MPVALFGGAFGIASLTPFLYAAIQATNVIFVAAVALMSAYIFSWSQPARQHLMAIALSFAFAVIATWWMANVLYPLADGRPKEHC